MASLLLQHFGQLDYGFPSGTPSVASHTVDANNEGVQFIFQATSTDAHTHIGFRYGSRTGTPPTYIGGFEGIDASTGLADGTYKGGGSPASATFTPPASTAWNGLWQWIALSNSYSPAAIGEWLCVTIRYSSGTIDGSNNSSFTTNATNIIGGANMGMPFAARNTSGSWAKQGQMPVVGVRTAGSRSGFIVESIYNTRSASTVGHRRALEFVVPSNATTTYKVRGLRFTGSIASAVGKAPVLGLWSASSTIQSKTLDSDYPQSLASFQLHEIHFDGALTALTPGTTYYCGLEVADATNGDVLINGVGFGAADDMGACPGGTAWRLASYDGATWTSDTLTRPYAELVLEDMTVSGGGGFTGIIGS